jgi:hypothetical protein
MGNLKESDNFGDQDGRTEGKCKKRDAKVVTAVE